MTAAPMVHVVALLEIDCQCWSAIFRHPDRVKVWIKEVYEDKRFLGAPVLTKSTSSASEVCGWAFVQVNTRWSTLMSMLPCLSC